MAYKLVSENQWAAGQKKLLGGYITRNGMNALEMGAAGRIFFLKTSSSTENLYKN